MIGRKRFLSEGPNLLMLFNWEVTISKKREREERERKIERESEVTLLEGKWYVHTIQYSGSQVKSFK